MTTESQADVNLEGDSAFMQILGLSFEEMGSARVVASFETGPDHHQPWGLVHGGVFTAVIETVATTGAYQAVKDQGQLGVGVNNVTDFLRPHQQAGSTWSPSPYSRRKASSSGRRRSPAKTARPWHAARFPSKTSRRTPERFRRTPKSFQPLTPRIGMSIDPTKITG